MADRQLTLRSERIAEVQLYVATIADYAIADGDADMWLLPANAPDIMIMEILLQASVIQTPIALTELGAAAFIFDPASATPIDFVGTGKWWKVSATSALCLISPDPLVLMRKNERLNLKTPDLDTGTTADMTVYVKGARLHEVVTNWPQPIRLVRDLSAYERSSFSQVR